jgi:hypothetical protein
MTTTSRSKCWECTRFKVAKAGKTDMVLDCGFASFGKWSRDAGFYQEDCPGFVRDTKIKN